MLVLAVILVYQPVWWAGFIWDDDYHVTANRCVVGPLGLKEIWTTNVVRFCPLVFTTFWLEHALWGLAPLPYHLVNVLMHAAGAVLLWRVLLGLQVPGAWLGAALWAVHPVEVESVAWISEMKNTESGLFFLLSILFFVRWLKARDSEGRTARNWNYGLTLLFAALAMASKSSTVILPVVLILCAWWIEGRWQWRNVAKVAPIFLMSVVAGGLTIWTPELEADDTQWIQTWPQRLATAGDAVWFYLGKLLWPHPLVMIYPRWQIDAGQWFSYLPLSAVIVVLLILWLKRDSWCRPWFFVFAYFLAALLPVLGLVSMLFFRYSLVADHFQYLASMGPLALAGAGLARLTDLIIPGRPWLRPSLGAGLLLILGLLSWHRVWAYESEEKLWIDTLAKNPDCWAGYNNLGDTLFNKGQVDEAMAQYQKAVDINPNFSEAHDNLGNALFEKGQVDEAIAQHQIALKIKPGNAQAYDNLGSALVQKGQVDEAIAQYLKALEIDPNYAKAHYNLGCSLFQKGQVDEAIDQFQIALEINPGFALPHNNLGVALFQKGRVVEAIAQYQMALEIYPNYAEAHHNLGLALMQQGEVDQAIAQYQMALEIYPNYAQIHTSLGRALAQKGQLDEAIAEFQEALRLEPNFSEAQKNLVNAQRLARQRAGQK